MEATSSVARDSLSKSSIVSLSRGLREGGVLNGLSESLDGAHVSYKNREMSYKATIRRTADKMETAASNLDNRLDEKVLR